jgi:hypothetical protein
MEKEQKQFLGKILGEIYRLQMHTNEMACGATKQRIFGLLHGIEEAIDEELETIGWVSNVDIQRVTDALEKFYPEDEKIAKFKGFYDIESGLRSLGLSRGQISQVIKYFKAGECYLELIEKMDSTNSPSECRKFRESEFDI